MERVLDAIVSIVFAPACAACGEALERPTEGPVCARCWRAVRPITPPVCDGCGDPLPSGRAAVASGGLCARCLQPPRLVDRGRAAGEYDGSLREILHAFKYDGRRSLAAPLARLMMDTAGEVLTGADAVVPVPLHWRRRHQRGFNQATDLATRLDRPVLDVLRRVRATRPQSDLSAVERRRNVRDAFALRRGCGTRHANPPARLEINGPPWRLRAVRRSIDGLCVVLVDDVSTTGATLEACARVLKQGGAREVRALTAARAVARQP